jgi:hypothetical protein
MGIMESFGFNNIELWRSEEMQLVQVRTVHGVGKLGRMCRRRRAILQAVPLVLRGGCDGTSAQAWAMWAAGWRATSQLAPDHNPPAQQSKLAQTTRVLTTLLPARGRPPHVLLHAADDPS